MREKGKPLRYKKHPYMPAGRKRIKPDLNQIEQAVNPFVANPSFKIKINVLVSFDKNGGVHESELEAQQYTKLFRSSTIRQTITRLCPAAKSILFWLMYSTEKTRHCVWIDRPRLMKECRISSANTLRTAIRQLTTKGFIAPTVQQTVYWINPTVFFCGSRINKYPENVERLTEGKPSTPKIIPAPTMGKIITDSPQEGNTAEDQQHANEFRIG